MEEVYPLLVRSYLQFCNFRKNCLEKGVLDLSDLTWAYPTTLLPLFQFILLSGVKFKVPEAKSIKNYFLTITGNRTQDKQSSFIPIIKANRLDDSYIDQIYGLISSGGLCNENTIKYIIGELVANISEHSKCSQSFFMAQNYKKKGFLEAAFIDSGVTIPGSFRTAGLTKNNKDCESIKEAVSGKSTKPEGGRGYGLPSTTKILKDMNSDILIISGKGALYLNGTNKYVNGDILYNLTDHSKLDGTLVTFQTYFPVKNVDIYKGGYL